MMKFKLVMPDVLNTGCIQVLLSMKNKHREEKEVVNLALGYPRDIYH